MRRSLAAAAISLLPGIALAAGVRTWNGPLTLAQAVTRAEEAGFQVQAARDAAEVSSAQAAAVRSTLLPQMGLSATTMNGGITQLGMPVAQQNYVSANVTVPLFEPSAFASARGAERTALAAESDAGQAMSDAMLAAVQAYENALLARAIYEARVTTVSYERRHLHDVGIMVKGGALPRYAFAESQAAFEQAVQSEQDAAAQRDETMNDLKVVLALDLRSSVSLAEPLRVLPMNGAEAAFLARAASSRPDITAAQSRVDAARAHVDAARAAYLPTIAASAQTYNGNSRPYLGNHGYQVGVSVSLPIIDSGSRAAAFHVARASLASAKVMLDQARLSAQRDVANAWREYEAAAVDLRSARAEEMAARQTLRITMLRERSGKGITLETLDALAQDAAAREGVLRAITRLDIAVATVHHAAGDTSL